MHSKGKLLQVICAFIEPNKWESYWINKLKAWGRAFVCQMFINH